MIEIVGEECVCKSSGIFPRCRNDEKGTSAVIRLFRCLGGGRGTDPDYYSPLCRELAAELSA